jgi:sRNA-binding protein
MTRRSEYDAAVDVLIELRQAFPQVISRLDVHKRRPLKIGISQDVQSLLPEVDPQVIGHAMRIYCSDRRYLAGLVAGAPRIDLTSAWCGEVTADQATTARKAGLKAAARARAAAAQPIQAKKVS